MYISGVELRRGRARRDVLKYKSICKCKYRFTKIYIVYVYSCVVAREA